MKGIYTLLIAGMTAGLAMPAAAQEARTMRMYDEVVFYDGYNDNVMDADLNDGILRHRNNLYAVRMTDEQLNWFGDDLVMDIVIGALCDNYDRIGNVNLALVPKGAETYDWQTTTRVELARFITPFMNKNKQPDEVPYRYEIDAASLIFRDKALRDKYDFWLEFELFGIPYAANTQVAGCADRNDVFDGTLTFTSVSDPQPLTDKHVFVPIVIKRPEYMGHNLNNYSEQGTDEIGRCIKTWSFEVPEDCADARITLITSNHGANAGGEEYVRRWHYVRVDGTEVLNYLPGGKSCEPYRVYNTQGNGIYSTSRDDSFWKRHSNWCPGDAIPIREINLGALSKGKHTMTIEVPKAEFVDQQGDFPVSAYLQGMTEGQLPAGLYTPEMLEPETKVTMQGDMLTWQADRAVAEVYLYDAEGRYLGAIDGNQGRFNMQGYAPGVYMVALRCTDGSSAIRKVLKN